MQKVPEEKNKRIERGKYEKESKTQKMGQKNNFNGGINFLFRRCIC